MFLIREYIIDSPVILQFLMVRCCTDILYAFILNNPSGNIQMPQKDIKIICRELSNIICTKYIDFWSLLDLRTVHANSISLPYTFLVYVKDTIIARDSSYSLEYANYIYTKIRFLDRE